MSSPSRLLVLGCLVWGEMSAVLAAADAPSPEKVEYFEKQVRPLLVQHCQECHGARKQEAGLRLDNRRGFEKGAESGPVVIAGNIDGSRLIQVLNHSPNEVQMPPKSKLPAGQIAIIRKWVEMGTVWPDDAGGPGSPADAAKNHWAFQPVRRPLVPSPPSAGARARVRGPHGDNASPPDKTSSTKSINDNNAATAISPPHPNPLPPKAGGEGTGLRSPIDSFIVAALDAKGLALSSPADRYTFIRRATLDLWGIPPTFVDVREFDADQSPDAHERLLDRLLASPLYGQRWARHWLDVARYADTKGYVFTQEPRYPYSYTYRDYVVDAFNADKPFDQFVLEQLAADQLGMKANDEALAAMGFLTVGRRFLNNNHDIIDDRIDVVSRGVMGLTVTCARCHDHKFDPVPTADYYSLYGVFASSVEPDDLPIIGEPKEAAAFQAFQTELAKREQAVLEMEQQAHIQLMDELRDRAGDCLVAAARENNNWLKLPALFELKAEPRKSQVERWKKYVERTGTASHPVFAPWHQLAKVGNDEFPQAAAKLVERWKSAEGEAEADAAKLNPLVRKAIIEKPPQTIVDLARIYGTLFQQTASQWRDQLKQQADAKSLADPHAEQLRQVLYGEGSPAVVTLDEARGLFGRDVRDKITKVRREAEKLKISSPGAPPRAMVMRDGGVHNARILIRGNPGRSGNEVPRQFLEVVAGPERKPFAKGSGRLELAQAIIDPKNPLTPRVLVNRVWQHHFGTGLVPTPSDFGTRGLPPSHPELLDWLASEVTEIAPHWSIKRLHRAILMSSVYRQSSADNPAAKSVDSENRLLWKMPRQRLDFEAMRDALLAVSGQLDTSLGGRPFENQMDVKSHRRTIYGLVNRNDLPGVFRAFDFADTEATAAERPQTTVPQQALFALNAPFVQEQARQAAAFAREGSSDDSTRLSLLYRRVLSREPTSEERELALRYLYEALTTPTEKLTPWDRLAQVLLLTNEFLFVD